MTDNYRAEWQARFGEMPDLALGEMVDPALQKILLRRTHRRYATRPVSEELLQLLLGASFSASSKSDFQQASVIRIAARDRRQRLAALIPDMPWIGLAPVFLLFCGDARRLERVGDLRGHPNNNGRLDGFFNAAIDAALAMQTFILSAEAVGLGCCAISAIRNHPDAVAEILELPDKVFPVAGLCLGYPAGEGFVSMRLPLSVTLHTDRYDDTHLGTEIDDYDRRRNARYSPPRDQQRAADIFGYADLYGWSEDKSRQAAAEPEGQSFSGYLRARGFSFD
jgi:nitroreductase